MKLLVPWIATMQCGDRSSKNQRSVVSTNSQSITRIIDRDSGKFFSFINSFLVAAKKIGNNDNVLFRFGWRFSR